MTRSRFLSARCAPFLLLGSSFLLFGAGLARAQTAPDLDAPTPASPSTAAPTTLLEETFDVAPDAVDGPQPLTQVGLAQEAGASSGRAVAWKYSLGRDEPRLSWARTLDLSTARSIALKIKADQPGAIEVWFETQPRGEGANSIALRYSATVASATDWRSLDLDRARFSAREIKGGVLQSDPAPSALWEAGWSNIARWGVADTSNLWRLFAGQTRASGPRTLLLDDLRLSTATAANSTIAKMPEPKPDAPPQGADQGDKEGDEADEAPHGANPGGAFNPGAAVQPPGYNGQPLGYPGAGGQYPGYPGTTGQYPGRVLEDEGQGGQGGQGDQDEGGQRPVAREVEVQAVVQDAWGAPELWIPINATTVGLENNIGLKWSFVRLANRNAMLFSPVNAEMLKAFPPDSVLKPKRDATVVIRGGSDRLLRLAIGIAASRNTIVQVAIYESGGGVWTSSFSLSGKRNYQTPVIRLADFKNAPTQRDANGRIDLDRVVAVSLQDVGAQKGMAGPNDITVRGMTWIY